ncbi:hypothetical protein NEOC65_001018 [Neochlamydia sp. AcF65]|nr:hypothetical protein [Neochlamydia sp. AcF65]
MHPSFMYPSLEKVKKKLLGFLLLTLYILFHLLFLNP